MVDPARLRRLPGRGEEGVQGRIPLAERSAWEDWITRDRAEIAQAESQIDSIVYGLFNLRRS